MSYDPFPSHPHRPPPPPYRAPYDQPSPPPYQPPPPPYRPPYDQPPPPPHQPPPPPFGHATPTPHRAPRRPPLGHHSDLRVLRTAYRWQRRTATLTALGYFTLFLFLSAYAPGFMTGTSPVGGLPTGLLLALLQLPVTWLAIALYEHTARRHVDPLADRIRKEAELDARRGAGR
ncbi:DUF485 domain-containing protein [Streptomyces mutabilis]|uniref:DUF485 domain-containing protein n=1 Tax=Streptomyces TaxID=1883 RepID=UPI00368C1B00